jgi:hypothetical protein
LTSLKHRTAFSFFLPRERLSVWLLARTDCAENSSASPDYPAEAKLSFFYYKMALRNKQTPV